MTESKVSTISKNYAKALLEVAKENNSEELFKQQLEEVFEVLKSSEDLRIVMANSSISASKKIEILTSVFAGKVDLKIMNLLKLLVEKGRFGEFEAILNSYTELFDKMSNKKNVEIISSIPLHFEEKTNVLFKLEHKLRCEITPHWTVDESIIAGLIIKFDDYVIDSSVRNKIENLSKKISV